MIDLDSLPLVPAFWQIVPSSPRLHDVIVIHSAESVESVLLAESLGVYFNRHPQITSGERKASTHYGVDCDSVGYYVPLENICYGAGGVNHNGIHIEHAGTAYQSRDEWLDDFSQQMLKLSAQLTAALCLRFAIPAMWLAPDDLLRGLRGVTSHVNACVAFGGDHWDPGPCFPEDLYMQWVRENLEPQPKDDMMPDYIIRNGRDLSQPWLAVYPSGALRHIGGTEAGKLLDPAQGLVSKPTPVIDELDTAAYDRARVQAGA